MRTEMKKICICSTDVFCEKKKAGTLLCFWKKR